MKSSYTDNNLHIFLAISTIVHIVVISVMFFGIPLFPRSLPEEKIITFELLPVSSVNNVKTKKIQKDATVKSDDAKKIEKTKVKEETPEEQSEKKESEKKEDPKDEPKKDAEPLPTVKNKEEIKEKKEDKPKDDKKSEAKKDVKKDKDEKKKPEKKAEKKKKAPNDKEIESLLKNLEKESEGNDKTNKLNREKSDAESDAFGNFDDNSPESLTNDELIRQQIMRRWNQPIASATEEIIIIVNLSISIDGTVEKVDIGSVSCPSGKDVLCSATKDSIIRAITNASPLVNLLPDDYSSWKEIKITFDTRR
jgi:outer membrane biosynthesis protein TonB